MLTPYIRLGLQSDVIERAAGPFQGPFLMCPMLQELNEKRVTLMEGTALSERDLQRSRAESASAVFLLADRFSSNYQQEDLNVQFQVGCGSCLHHCMEPSCALLLHNHTSHHLKMSNSPSSFLQHYYVRSQASTWPSFYTHSHASIQPRFYMHSHACIWPNFHMPAEAQPESALCSAHRVLKGCACC